MGGTTSTRRDAISVTNMGSTLDERMGKIENSVTDVDVRLARMEQAMATMFSTASRFPMKGTGPNLWLSEVYKDVLLFTAQRIGYMTL